MKNTAGLLTRFFLSRRLPEKTSVAYRHKGFQQKLTAAGLSGIFTRFPFKRYDSAPLFSRKISIYFLTVQILLSSTVYNELHTNGMLFREIPKRSE
jgi:hypothetical protein